MCYGVNGEVKDVCRKKKLKQEKHDYKMIQRRKQCLLKLRAKLREGDGFTIAETAHDPFELSTQSNQKILQFRKLILWGYFNPGLEYLRTTFDTQHTKNQRPKNTSKLS